MFLRRGGDFGRQAGGLGVVAAHEALKLGEFADHLGLQIGLRHPRGLFGEVGEVGIGADDRRDLVRQGRDALHPVLLAAELVVEGDRGEALGPVGHARPGDAQVVFPEERRIGQARREDLLVAGEDGRAVVGGLDIGDGDEFLDPAGLGIADREELLVLLHRGLQHLGGQRQEAVLDVAHQHDGPFHEAGDLAQQALVLDQFQPAREGDLLRVVPQRLGPFVRGQDHLGALQLGLVILEARDLERGDAHEAVAARDAARLDAVDLERDDGCLTRVVGEDAQDRVQRTDPAQAARAPAHGLGPGEGADGLFQLLGHDRGGGAAFGDDGGVVEGALLVLALLELVARHAGAAAEALDRLVGRTHLGAAAFLAQGGRMGGEALQREREAARRGEGARAGVCQARLDQPVGHRLLQVGGGLFLHAGGNFLGEELDQEIRHLGLGAGIAGACLPPAGTCGGVLAAPGAGVQPG